MIFNKKRAQFNEIRQLRQQYKHAQQNYEAMLWYISEENRTIESYDENNNPVYEKVCIFQGVSELVDYDMTPAVFMYQEYCKFYDESQACSHSDCSYNKLNIATIQSKKECENIHDKLRAARRRFWGLEK